MSKTPKEVIGAAARGHIAQCRQSPRIMERQFESTERGSGRTSGRGRAGRAVPWHLVGAPVAAVPAEPRQCLPRGG